MEGRRVHPLLEELREMCGSEAGYRDEARELLRVDVA